MGENPFNLAAQPASQGQSMTELVTYQDVINRSGLGLDCLEDAVVVHEPCRIAGSEHELAPNQSRLLHH